MASRKIVNNLTVALHQLFVHSVLNKVLRKHYTFSVLYFRIYTSITLQAKVDKCGSHERLRQRIKCCCGKNLITMKKVIRVVCPVFVPFGTKIN